MFKQHPGARVVLDEQVADLGIQPKHHASGLQVVFEVLDDTWGVVRAHVTLWNLDEVHAH